MTQTDPDAVTETVLRDRFLDAMRLIATPVSIVTTAGAGGRMGLTVSSFNSVCAEPPVVSVCINQRSPIKDAIMGRTRFNVNVLHDEGSEIAGVFAGMAGKFTPFDFACTEWVEDTFGLPVMLGAVASLSCSVLQTLDVGTHRLFLGAVDEVILGDGHTLLHYRRGFHRPVAL